MLSFFGCSLELSSTEQWLAWHGKGTKEAAGEKECLVQDRLFFV